MNLDKNQGQQNDTSMCKSCNLFYGNPVNDYLCSKCFQTTKQSANTMTKDPEPQMRHIQQQIIENKVSSFEEEKQDIQEVKQTDTLRCWQCRKKVNLMGIECKCKFVFCSKHRMPEDHECTFDHAQRGKDRLREEQISCVASKIQKF